MLFCIASIATLSSCSKDKEDLIVGKWKPVEPAMGLLYLDVCDYLEFSDNGTVIISGSTEGDPDKSVFAYSVTGNILAIGWFDDFEIVELSKKTLKLKDNYHDYTFTFERVK